MLPYTWSYDLLKFDRFTCRATTNATSATEWVTGRVTVLKTGRAVVAVVVGVVVEVAADTVAAVALDLAPQDAGGKG